MTTPDQPSSQTAGTDSNQDADPAAAASGAVDERLVPVSEAIRYRKRAQTAEQQLAEVQASLQSTSTALDEARQVIDQLERRQRIDAMLAESDAVDMEVARLLTEAAVEMMDEPDVEAAVHDLRRHKPYLFRQRTAAKASAMPARTHAAPPAAHDAAEQAMTTGNRRDLLRYLRLRRQC